MSTPVPSVLLLDFGAVISRSLFETLGDIERTFDLEAGSLDWRGPFDPKKDQLWSRMQRGDLSERDYWYTRASELSAAVGETLTIQDIITRSRPVLDDICRPEAINAIDVVKASGMTVAIATNELLLFYGSDRVNASRVVRQIDHVFDSSYTKILKPDARAFALILSGLNQAAENLVFIDDQKRNIDGAIASGIPSVHLDIRDPAAAFRSALNAMDLNATGD